MSRKTRLNFFLMLVGFGLSANSYAYPTSADAHKACDPTGVQYDYTNKQYCCGTSGGCPNALKPVSKPVSTGDRPAPKAAPGYIKAAPGKPQSPQEEPQKNR